MRDKFEQVASEIPFDNNPNGTPVFTESTPENVQEALEASGEKGQLALDTPRYTILLQNNGVVSGGTFIGYDSLIPGDATPVIIPINSQLIEFTWSNSRSTADFTLIFRRNSTTTTAFYSTSRTNAQFFAEDGVDQIFDAGDQIYIQYQDDGGNASDAVIVLVLKALP